MIYLIADCRFQVLSYSRLLSNTYGIGKIWLYHLRTIHKALSRMVIYVGKSALLNSCLYICAWGYTHAQYFYRVVIKW